MKSNQNIVSITIRMKNPKYLNSENLRKWERNVVKFLRNKYAYRPEMGAVYSDAPNDQQQFVQFNN